jgi:hypothetical protein
LSTVKDNNSGLAKEHRLTLARIRCMSWDQYQILRERWKGQGLAPAAKSPVTKGPAKVQQNAALENKINTFD